MTSLGYLVILSTSLFSGCHTSKVTEPSRTAAELLMLSHSADHAIREMDFSTLDGKKLFLDVSYFESVDKPYVLGALREKLGEDGLILLSSSDEAEYILELRSRGLGLDTRTSLFGLPSMDIPIPLAGRITSPELAFYKAQKADSIASFALAVYRKTDGLDLELTSSGAAESTFNQYQILGFIKWRSTDIPELKPTSFGIRNQIRKPEHDTR